MGEESREMLARENRVMIESLEHSVDEIRGSVKDIQSSINNELLHRVPISILITISTLTAFLGAAGMSIMMLLRK